LKTAAKPHKGVTVRRKKLDSSGVQLPPENWFPPSDGNRIRLLLGNEKAKFSRDFAPSIGAAPVPPEGFERLTAPLRHLPKGTHASQWKPQPGGAIMAHRDSEEFADWCIDWQIRTQ